jgi:DNA gyrase/topoisomerase IV subunit B
MEIALQYNDGYSETLFSFANNINTVDGGSHLSGFRSALTRTINAYGQQAGLFKDLKENLTGDDVREGLTAVISVKLPQPQFEGQTKGKLNSDIRARGSTRQRETRRVLRQEPAVMKKIVGKAIDASPAPAKPPARPATSPAARARSIPAACPANWPTARSAIRTAANCSWSRVSRPAAPPKRPRSPLPGDPAAQGQDPQRRKGPL